jgi:hypothetical protein
VRSLPSASATATAAAFDDWLGGLCVIEGVKADVGKPRFSLFPHRALAEVLRVLEAGARKYSVNNWMKVPELRTRYYDALQRHAQAWWLGERNDQETGLHHLAHACCCVLFLLGAEVGDIPAQEEANTNPTEASER